MAQVCCHHRVAVHQRDPEEQPNDPCLSCPHHGRASGWGIWRWGDWQPIQGSIYSTECEVWSVFGRPSVCSTLGSATVFLVFSVLRDADAAFLITLHTKRHFVEFVETYFDFQCEER